MLWLERTDTARLTSRCSRTVLQHEEPSRCTAASVPEYQKVSELLDAIKARLNRATQPGAIALLVVEVEQAPIALEHERHPR